MCERTFTHSTTWHLFQDQFALRPTGSPTSAIIHLTQRVSDLLQEHQFVHVIALDFSKAFDTVRHNTLMQKNGSVSNARFCL